MYWALFGVLTVVCIAVRWYCRDSSEQQAQKEQQQQQQHSGGAFKAFQRNYLLVYLIVMGADWLQGPYVYALYDYYGFNKSDIAYLFIAGFMSSMVVGTFVGSLADKYGRKLLCVLFGVFYSISCLTKLVNDFNTLLVGRILSGIATSLLFSSFESWMVAEHKSRGFASSLLSDTFSLATFGNGIVAIVAGLVASFVVDKLSAGYVAPFMVSLVMLVIGSLLVLGSWTENYGDSQAHTTATFTNALHALRNDSKIVLLGLVQSLFEGAMYTFVFMWTPALQAAAALKLAPGEEPLPLPFGVIFATFMVSIMIGSSVFGLMLSRLHMGIEEVGRVALIVAAVALAVPVFASDELVIMLSFVVFEACCGIYFPCFGTMRGKYVPEQTRAAIMNFFRVPLNFLVVIVLVEVGEMATTTVFAICAVWLLVALALHAQFKRLTLLTTHDQETSDASLPVVH